jgi:toxin ParE1/3/4
MNSKAFEFHPEARAEFREAGRWYRTRNAKISTEFRRTVSSTVEEIAQAPHCWPTYLHGTRRFVLHRFPFSIIYLDDPELVTIIAVAHSNRKPDTGSIVCDLYGFAQSSQRRPFTRENSETFVVTSVS